VSTDYDNWNQIPYDQNATPQEKADEFDLQLEQNQTTPFPPLPPVSEDDK
jgi:hypothetical protein